MDICTSVRPFDFGWKGTDLTRALFVGKKLLPHAETPSSLLRQLQGALTEYGHTGIACKLRDLSIAILETNQDGNYSTDRARTLIEKFRAGNTVTPFPGYTSLELLARGGTSTVYRAINEETQQAVVIKSAKARSSTGQLFSSRHLSDCFEREWETREKIKSPHIIQAIDRGLTENHKPFLVMEYLNGGTLRQWVTYLAAGAIDFDWFSTYQIIRGVLETGCVFYEHGFIHRDIKPDNLFLTDKGEVKAFDFERTIHQSETNKKAEATGTLSYMRFGDSSSFRADVVSLAITSFEIATGRRPFPTSGGILDLLPRAAKDLPVPSHLQPLIPRGLAKEFDRWTALGLNQRNPRHFANAQVMCDDFLRRPLLPKKIDRNNPNIDVGKFRVSSKDLEILSSALSLSD